MKVDKTKFKDEKGRYIVQGLFLEDRYNTDLAVYTQAGEDKEYRGVNYPSLKRLYLEEGDPTEYAFAQKYLYDWPHWQRMCRNNMVGRLIEEWREELYLSLRADGISAIIDAALSNSNYQAAKWLADKGWEENSRGRPSKEEVKAELKKQAEKEREFNEDFELLTLHKGNKK